MSYEIKQGDCLEVLKTLESESVQCCVTSPPYYGLRNYGVEGQIGLEGTPQAFVAKLVQVFEEVWRVLKPDGTCWLNLGDSYTGSGKGGNPEGSKWKGFVGSNQREAAATAFAGKDRLYGLKPKENAGVPWLVAFALQEAGWYLRQDIIWAKPNPMPESVTDRCTKSHEYIFLLTKNAKYYYDGDAIKEPSTEANWQSRLERVSVKSAPTAIVNGIRDRSLPRNRNGITGSLDNWGSKNVAAKGQTPNTFHLNRLDGTPDDQYLNRNKRSVWTVTTQPFTGYHFATFPPKLIEPCILAGSKEGDTVLDPFNGSGTTGMVSLQHRRSYIGIELNPDYIKIAEKRLTDVQVKLF